MSIPVPYQIIAKIKDLQEKVRILNDFLNVGGLAGVKISEMIPVPSDLLITGDLFEIARLGTPNHTYNATIDDISNYVIDIADDKYLQILNNLSDVNNRTISTQNLGFPRGFSQYSPSIDLTLTNPLPDFIVVSPQAANLKIILPPVDQVNSIDIGEGPTIININSIYTMEVVTSLLTHIEEVHPGNFLRIILSDNSTAEGIFQNFGEVSAIVDLTFSGKATAGFVGLSNNLRLLPNEDPSTNNLISGLIDFFTNISQLSIGTTTLAYNYVEKMLTDGAGGTTTLLIPDETSSPFQDYTYFRMMRIETNPSNQYFLNSDPAVTIYSIDNPSGTAGGSFELTDTFESIQLTRLGLNQWLLQTFKTDLQTAYDFSDGIITLDDAKPLEIQNSAGSSVNFNTTGNNAFEINSTTQGSLGWPLLTTLQRDAIPSPTIGLHAYDITLNAPVYYDGTQWLANQHIDLPLSPEEGGTGIANDPTDTITLGGPITTANEFHTAGNFSLTLTTTALTNATIPAGTVTLVALPGSTSLTTLGTITTGTWQADVIEPQWGGTGVANGAGDTITLGGAINTGGIITTANNFVTTGNFPLTLTTTALTNATIPAGTVTLVALPGSTSLTTLGTVTTGVWNASIISPTYGGTGINNGSNTIDIAGNIVTANSFTTVGNFPLTLTTTGTTNATIPSGTVTLLAAPGSSSITTVGTITTGTWQADVIGPQWGGTGIANGSGDTITLGGAITTGGQFNTVGASSLTLTTTGTTNATLPAGTVTLVALPGSTSLTTLGTITTGTWNGTIIDPIHGGTGILNTSTITLGGPIHTQSSLTQSGPGSLTLTTGGAPTNATFPSGTITLVALPGSTSLTTLGTITTGTWQGSVISSAFGGTGINNNPYTISLGGSIATGGTIVTQNNFTLSGNFPLTFTMTGTTNATIPSGTVTLLAAPGSSSITTVGTITTGTWQADVIGPQWGGTGVANGSGDTITLGGAITTGGPFHTSGSSSLTFTTTGTTNATVPSGTVTLATVPDVTTVPSGSITIVDSGIYRASNGGTIFFNLDPSIPIGAVVYICGTNPSGDWTVHTNGTIYTDQGTSSNNVSSSDQRQGILIVCTAHNVFNVISYSGSIVIS